MSVYDTYLINLDASVDRLEAAKEQLAVAKIPFTRIPAVDGRGVDPGTYHVYNEKKALSYMGRKLNGGELGCYLSHLKAAHRFLSTDKQYAMVLEDDIVIPSSLNEHIEKIIHWLEDKGLHWDLINIGEKKIKIHTPLLQVRVGEALHLLTRSHYFSMTAHGLLWSRAGAKAFVDSEMLIYMPVDNYLREWLTQTNTGLAVWPPLIKTSGAESEIDDRAASSRKSVDRSFFYGFLKQKREFRNKFKALNHKFLTSKSGSI